MLRFPILLLLFTFFNTACDISEDKVKTIIVVDELTKDKSYLSDNQIIKSKNLNYDLQYRVYTPLGYEKMENLASIYFLDGQWFIESANITNYLDKLIKQKKIKPVVAIFLDNRDPHQLKRNRRNSQFLGNEEYIKFLKDELVPEIDQKYKTNPSAAQRAITGISFGAVCTAFAGLKASDTFQNIGCQSPAMHPVLEMYDEYETSENLSAKFFLSTGTKNDKLKDTQRFKEIFEKKQYEYIYREVDEGHNWKNWEPLMDDLLIYFFED